MSDEMAAVPDEPTWRDGTDNVKNPIERNRLPWPGISPDLALLWEHGVWAPKLGPVRIVNCHDAADDHV